MNAEQFDAWAEFQMKRLERDVKLASIMWEFKRIELEGRIATAKANADHARRMAEYYETRSNP